MRGYSFLFLVVACLVALTAGLTFDTAILNRPTFLRIYCNHRKVVANANRLFGVDLYKKVKGVSSSKNIIMSPFSVSAALAMTYAGAYGPTRSQMHSVLRFNSFPYYCSVNEGFRQLLKAFGVTHFNHTLKVADRLFVDTHFKLLKSYKHVTKYYYGAQARNCPFHSHPDYCRKYINRWVKWHTDNQIENLLPAGSVYRNSVLVLVNAITFEGRWKNTFTSDNTMRQRFYFSSTHHVDMMTMACNTPTLRYAYVPSIRSEVVELKYYASPVAMYVVLPKWRTPLSYVENRFTWNPDSLGLKYRKVIVSMPKFKMTKDTTMTALLKTLGMTYLFDKYKADLRRIAGRTDMWIEDVFHQAFINVHEQGTEASAATAVHGCVNFLKRIKRDSIVKFTANRPFLFFIWDRQTKSLLFNGRFTG